MKRIFLYLLCLPLLGLISCGNGNNPEWTEQYKQGGYYLVKFRPDAMLYRPNVMLVPDAKGNYTMRSLQNGGTCKEFFLFHDPFIKIDTVSSWYLADWKWGLKLSYANSVLLVRWVDVRQPDDTYVRSDFMPAASNILDTIAYVTRSDIDWYLHLDAAPAATTPGPWGRTSGGISTDHLAPVYLSRYYSAQDIPEVIDRKNEWEYTKADFLAERLRQDSLQEVYRARLEQLVYSKLINSVISIQR